MKTHCPRGHEKTPENTRKGRSDCAVCHREQERSRSRSKGAQERLPVGAQWTCGHDPFLHMRPGGKGCAQCHRENEKRRYHTNPAKAIEAVVRWQRENKDRYNARSRAWRATGKRSPTMTAADQKAAQNYLTVIVNDVCSYCGGPVEHIDHIVPLARGGGGLWTNLTPACAPCNQSKNARSLLVFLLETNSTQR